MKKKKIIDGYVWFTDDNGKWIKGEKATDDQINSFNSAAEFNDAIDVFTEHEQANNKSSKIGYVGGGDNWGTNDSTIKTKEEAIKLYKNKYWPLVKDLPPGLRTRALQLAINTGDPYGELLVASGKIDPTERKKLVDEANSKGLSGYAKTKYITDKRLANNASDINNVSTEYTKNPTDFFTKLDTEQKRYYGNLTDYQDPKYQKFYSEYVGKANDVATKYIPKASTSTTASGTVAKTTVPMTETEALNPDKTYTAAEAYGPKGVKNLNRYLKEYNIAALPSTASKAEIVKAVSDMQKSAIKQNPELINYYMQHNVEPNNKLRDVLSQKGFDRSKTGLQKAVKEGKITSDEIKNAYNDEQWWYRAVGTNKKRLTKDEYDKKMKDPNAIKQDDKLFFNDDPNNPEAFTEYFTDEPKKEEVAGPKKDDEVVLPPKKDIPLRNYKTPPAEFWLQDKINMAGAWGDMQRIKKYPPWMATAGFTLPEGMYYSPERELAANSEMINQGIQGASTFTGPQGYAATAGYLHGQGAKTAADIMGRYNNLNVTEANRLSDSTNAVLNYASQQRATNATQLFDKNTVMNQQFDNSKALARQKLRQGYMDALTNRANTYNLNTINPQFAVSAANSGMIYNIPGSDRELNNQYRGQETPEEYMDRVKKIKGINSDDTKFLYDNYPGASKPTASNKTPSDATYEAMQRGYLQHQQAQQAVDETDETS